MPDGQAQNFTGLLIGLELGTLLRLANDRGALVRDLVAQTVKQFLLGLVGGHARDTLETDVDLLHGIFQIALAALDLALHGRQKLMSRASRLSTRRSRLSSRWLMRFSALRTSRMRSLFSA